MKQRPSFSRGMYAVLARVSSGYPPLLGRFLRVTHPSATLLVPEGTFSFDLHVLSLPPTFNLSHDQTLQFKYSSLFSHREHRNARCEEHIVRRSNRSAYASPLEHSFGRPEFFRRPHEWFDRNVKERPTRNEPGGKGGVLYAGPEGAQGVLRDYSHAIRCQDFFPLLKRW